MSLELGSLHFANFWYSLPDRTTRFVDDIRDVQTWEYVLVESCVYARTGKVVEMTNLEYTSADLQRCVSSDLDNFCKILIFIKF